MMMRGARENIALASLNRPEFSSGPCSSTAARRGTRTRQLAERVDLQAA